MTTLYLIRHGETAWNAEGRFQGHRNTPLNEVGIQQAHHVARELAHYSLDAIFTSDLARAAQTAEIIAAHHAAPVIADRRLREAYFGEWEGLTLDEITTRWPDILAAWRQDSLHTRPPGGETLEQVQLRVVELLMELLSRYPDEHVAIVAHGGALRAIIAYALVADLSIFRRLRLDNCSITTITVRDGEFSLIQMNDICHLGLQIPRASWDEAGDQWRLAAQGEDNPSREK